MTPTSTVSYRARLRGIAPLADIYEPAAPRASVLLVHGGGFVIGSRRMKPMRFLAARLAAAEIAVCTIDYRMIFRGGRLEEAVDDVRTALGFWRARSAHPVSLIGLSAGAALARAAADADVAHIACCFGLYDVDHLRGVASVLPRLLFRTSDRTRWRFSAEPAAPTLLLHGDADRLVPVAQAHRLAAARTERDLPTKLVVYPGAPHAFFNRPCAAAEAAVDELVRWVL